MVVETDDRRRLPDEAVVEYEVEGSRYEATLMVSAAGDFEVGETIVVEYDPDGPSHARPLEGWSPTYQVLWMYAAIALPIAAVDAVLTRRKLGTEADLAALAEVHPMHGVAYRRGRWYRRTPSVALWPEGSDRPAAPPLSVEVEEAMEVAGPVSVVGGRRPGERVVLRAGGDTIWTTSRLRSGMDPRARPRG